jgi:hypothetical protein
MLELGYLDKGCYVFYMFCNATGKVVEPHAASFFKNFRSSRPVVMDIYGNLLSTKIELNRSAKDIREKMYICNDKDECVDVY